MPEYDEYIPGSDVRVQVDKIGGGTRPRAYEGAWAVTLISDRLGTLAEDELFNSPAPMTHNQVAKVAFEMATWDWKD